LEQVKTATADPVRAVKAGIFNAATEARMDELEQQQYATDFLFTRD